MSTLLSSLVDNLSDGLHSNECTNCNSSLDYMKVENNQFMFKCLSWNKNYDNDFNKELINRFSNTYKFCNGDINKFVLLLRKGVYPYNYMNSWERFNETLLPNKEDFYSCLNIEYITDIDCRHAKRVFEELEMNNFGDYHDLYDLYFLSAPGLTWQGYFKKTKVELQLLTDPNMLLMF